MKTTLNLKTLHGKKTKSTMVVEGIQVNGMRGDGSLLTCAKLYARREIPVDKQEIVAPAKIKEWKYLSPLSNKIVQKDDVQVGLLIGANYIKALQPTKIILSEDGVPYASETILDSEGMGAFSGSHFSEKNGILISCTP